MELLKTASGAKQRTDALDALVVPLADVEFSSPASLVAPAKHDSTDAGQTTEAPAPRSP